MRTPWSGSSSPFGYTGYVDRSAMRSVEQAAPVVTLIGNLTLASRRPGRHEAEERRLPPGPPARAESVLILDLEGLVADAPAERAHAIDAARLLIARALRESLRECDTLGSWGRAEFLALLPGASPRNAVRIARRLQASIDAINASSSTAPIGCSIGIAGVERETCSLGTLLRQADAALYEARRGGRGRVYVSGQPNVTWS
jgi:diguanylate cyclase (GGDEF)-like protein